MARDPKSSLGFRSNIYPVSKEFILNDEKFLHSLRDARALRVFDRRPSNYRPDKFQREILMRGLDTHCVHAETGDFPWGTAIVDGEECVVCRCENYGCPLFSVECRPGIEVPDAFGAQSKSAIDGTDGDEIEAGVVDAFDVAEGELGILDMSSTTEGVASVLGKLETFGDTSRNRNISNAVEEQIDVPGEITTRESIEFEDLRSSVESEEVSVADEHSGTEAGGAFESLIDDIDEKVRRAFQEEHREASFPSAEPDEVSDSTEETFYASDRYDTSQAKVIRAHWNERIIVNAGPGTGKTYSLIERLKNLMDDQGVNPDEILVLSFTRAAVAVIQNRLREAAINGELDSSWQDVEISTFDKFSTKLLYFIEQDESFLLGREFRVKGLDYDKRIQVAAKAIERYPDFTMGGVSHLIVDETQDLVGPRADLTLAMIKAIPNSCGITLLGDRCQSLYDYRTEKDGTLTTSEHFFDVVTEELHFKQLELTHTYRQKAKLPYSLNALRKGILNRDVDCASEALNHIMAVLPMPGRTIKGLDNEDFAPQDNCGSFGILTRTNTQSLLVSAQLWKMGIPHVLRRSDRIFSLTRAFADALCAYRHETIDEHTFVARAARYSSLSHDELMQMWFDATLLRGVNPEGGQYRIERLLAAIDREVLPPSLCSKKQNAGKVLVSTVHGAKGCEFDKVWVLAEDMSGIAEQKDLNEFKIAYVALSRPIFEAEIQSCDEDFLRTGERKWDLRIYLERCFKQRQGRHRARKNITHVEVRNDTDLCFGSMCPNTYLQEFMRSQSCEGMPVRLIQGQDGCYDIVCEDDESIVLGTTTGAFSEGYDACYRNAVGSVPKSRPPAFDQLYIDRVISCVGPVGRAPKSATRFGDYAIWYGFTLGGFAHRDDPQAY